MELEHIRKKVYMNTLASTYIQYQPHLLPQWTQDNHINFLSAYEFASYNLEEQLTHIISRQQGYDQVLSFQFKTQMNEHNCAVSFVCRKDEKYYLTQMAGTKTSKTLLYKNNDQRKSDLVFDFYDFFMAEGDLVKSSKSILARTNKLIDQLNEQEQNNNIIQDLVSVYQMSVLFDGTYALMLVEMKIRTGLMLVNVLKASREKEKDFNCPIRPTSLRKYTPDLSFQENSASRIIYLFPQKVISFHKTKDVTRFIIRTQNNLLLTKINYEQMELSILFGLQYKRETMVSVGMSCCGQDQLVLVFLQNNRGARYLRLHQVDQKKITQLKETYLPPSMVAIKTQHNLKLNASKGNVRFNDQVTCSHYNIQDEPVANDPDQDGLMLSVYRKMISEDRQNQRQAISQKQLLMKQNCLSNYTQKTISNKYQLTKEELDLMDSFTCNQDMMVFWEQSQPVMHICRIESRKEQQQKYRESKQQDKSKDRKKMKTQEQIKQVYSKLIGVEYQQREEDQPIFQPKFSYFAKVELDLTHRKIIYLALSPSNSNILIISTSDRHDALQANIFQLDLFKQLGNQDPGIFLKPLKNVYKPKPVEYISNGLIKQHNLCLSGTLIHSNQNELLDGVLAFDIHPYNFFVAVSFGFSVKVYALEGTQRLSSLFTLNGQGFKQLKYSPLGNHLCILTSKSIRIVDSYSFSTKYILTEKISNFSQCYYSSNGLQFYTLTEHHLFTIFNTFDYTKQDTIKPLKAMSQFKPVSAKSYLKANQYCFVLESGTLYVRYKSEAIVVTSERLYSYDDGEQVNCIEIDQKNGVLFVGCKSGRIRSHVWPMADHDTFEVYSQLRVSFAPITCISLSNLSPTLFAGSGNGNISKLKYTVDRDKGIDTAKQHNLLFTDRTFRYLGTTSNIQKIYRFVLSNSLNLSSDELPDKVCLEFRLSEVINKLKEEMRKLKISIREELQEKSKMTMEKVDFGMLHNMNHMIANKLYQQLREQIEGNRAEAEELKLKYKQEMNDLMQIQNELIKEKSFKTCDFSRQRQELKRELNMEHETFTKDKEAEIKSFKDKHQYARALVNSQQEETYFLPNQLIEEYEELKVKLEDELSKENRKHYELKKECAYKETAIKGLNMKKMKEETLEFKFNLEKTEMGKKLIYNKQIVAELHDKIAESQYKMHSIQTQAHIIKNNAMYKKTARVEQMIDACSYKLAMKEKLQEEDIAQFSKYLKNMEELMESKGEEVVDMILQNKEYLNKLAQYRQHLNEKRQQLSLAKMQVLNSRRAIQQFDCNQYLSTLNSKPKKKKKKEEKKPRLSCKVVPASTQRQLVTRSTSTSRLIEKNDRQIPMYYKLMDKEAGCLRINIKNHQRKVTKLGKQNGRILLEFERLKMQQKGLLERQAATVSSLQKVKNEEILAKMNPQRSQRPTLQLSKTSYQKYMEMKRSKSRIGLKYQTATSTPRHLSSALATPWLKDSLETTLN